MARKREEGSFISDEVVDDTIEEVQKQAEIIKPSKIRLQVYSITKSQLFLKDSNGTEYRLPVGEYKDKKIGDIVLL